MKERIGFLLLLLCCAVVFGCGGDGDTPPEAEGRPQKRIVRAMAYIDPKSGSELVGTAIFINEPGQVSMQIDVENAPPGQHAVHLHEVGDCSAEDGTSAGGHWNPTQHDHGKWGAEPFHLGDIGNLVVGKDGKGSLTLSAPQWSLGTGEANDILGRAVIVHEKADDFTTQPTGAAGGRIGCGVIES